MHAARFQSLRPWLIDSFGRPVHRVALDAGSSCPNRDGTRGRGGCTYCDVEGSGTGAQKSGLDLAEQLERGIARVARRDPGCGVIAYFQSFSNTYVDPERLDEVLAILDPWLSEPSTSPSATPIVCVAVATRPDTLSDWALERLEHLAQRTRVWVELGLETANDEILLGINRLHTVAEFEETVARCHGAGLETVGHAILGLPGDGRAGARHTAEVLAATGVTGIKVHHLMVLERTQMAHQYRTGQLQVLEPETYVSWLADFVERLEPGQVLHRITGDSPREKLIAPHWPIHKNEIRRLLDLELERRGTHQGSLFADQSSAR